MEDNAAALVPVQDALALDLPELVQRAQDYARKSKSDRTWKAYRSDLEHFSTWCLARGLAPVPAEPTTLRLYLTDHAGKLAVSTLSRRLSAITEAHQAMETPSPAASPEVQFTWAGIRRTHGKPPKGKRRPGPCAEHRLGAGVSTMDASTQLLEPANSTSPSRILSRLNVERMGNYASCAVTKLGTIRNGSRTRAKLVRLLARYNAPIAVNGTWQSN
jgi:Phage integrase, N-terminal SAM-like domain